MYKIPQLEHRDGLVHGFSTIDYGNMSFKFDDQTIVRNRRRKFLSSFNLSPNTCITPYLQHGTDVLVVNESQKGYGILTWQTSPRVDALITDQPNIHFFMLVADCMPIILYDPSRKALGLVHAGWKGTEDKIVVKTIEKMVNTLSTEPQNLLIAIGPSIRVDSYRFDNSRHKLGEKIHLWEPYLCEYSDKTIGIDLVRFTTDQLLEVGVKSENIYDSKVDTGNDRRFFSHYRDSKIPSGDCGRFACLVGMTVHE